MGHVGHFVSSFYEDPLFLCLLLSDASICVSLLIHVGLVLRENRVFKFQNVYAMVLAYLNSVNFSIFLVSLP